MPDNIAVEELQTLILLHGSIEADRSELQGCGAFFDPYQLIRSGKRSGRSRLTRMENCQLRLETAASHFNDTHQGGCRVKIDGIGMVTVLSVEKVSHTRKVGNGTWCSYPWEIVCQGRRNIPLSELSNYSLRA